MDNLHWTETTFDEWHMACFDPADTNYPTRIVCKALALEALGGLERLCQWVELLPPAPLARLLEAAVESFLTYRLATALFDRLAWWAEGRVISTAPGEARVVHSHVGLRRTAGAIDWTWIAARLRRELQEHGRRRFERLEELKSGVPFEQAEADVTKHEALAHRGAAELLGDG